MIDLLLPQPILVVGDLLLDTYTLGQAKRISPEAPVAVVQALSEEKKAGGAGNVAVSLTALGAQVRLLGRIGRDPAGQELLSLLSKEHVEVDAIYTAFPYPTPVKHRILADHQQVVRIDYETITPLTTEEEASLIARIPMLLEGVQLLAISDYGKGFLTPALLQALITQAKKQNAYVLVDPKGSDFQRYIGATLIKPNLSETYQVSRLPPQAPLQEAALRILNEISIDYLLVTRGDRGMTLFSKEGTCQDFPVHARQVRDVTGAGDTAFAALAMALANGFPLPDAIVLSNIAAGLAVERFGCARITLDEIADALLKKHLEGRKGQIQDFTLLKTALSKKPCALISLTTASPPTTPFISRLIEIKNRLQGPVIVSIEEEHPNQDNLNFWASLHLIDYLCVNCPPLQAKTLLPHAEIIELYAATAI